MMIRILSLFSILLILGSCDQGVKEQKQNLHGDHTVFAINKLGPHADFFAYESGQLAEQDEKGLSQRYISLNGEWIFHGTASPRDRIKNFYEIDLDDSKWELIPVPANWEVEGKDGGKSASGLVPVSTRHGADIRIGGTVQWNIDHLQMGVGGDNSWGRLVHKEYTITPGEYRYSFKIVPEKTMNQ